MRTHGRIDGCGNQIRSEGGSGSGSSARPIRDPGDPGEYSVCWKIGSTPSVGAGTIIKGTAHPMDAMQPKVRPLQGVCLVPADLCAIVVQSGDMLVAAAAVKAGAVA